MHRRSGGNATIVGNLLYGGVRGGVEIRYGGNNVLVADNLILEAGNTLGTARPIVPPATETGVGSGRRASGISLLEQPDHVAGITRVLINIT